MQLEARDDVVNAALWYEAQEKGLSEQLYAQIDTALDAIAERPRSFPVVHKRKHARRALVKQFPYRIFFREMPDHILVFAIVHGARSSRIWRSRL
jgi:toxin ParE1/3/4